MLAKLNVRNVALIEALELRPGPGFNVLTGETGAGKSMLIQALSLVLGGRARPELLRAGAAEAEVEAAFHLAPGSRAQTLLEAAGIPEGDPLVIRRTVKGRTGGEARSRAFANGKPCTSVQLAEMAPDLCDIASQHESVSLINPSTHLEYLDAFGGLDDARRDVAQCVDALLGAVRALGEAQGAEETRADREETLRRQAREIDDVAPKVGEEAQIDLDLSRLRHAEHLKGTAQRAADLLYEDQGSVCDVLARLGADLERAASLDPSLGPYAKVAASARAELADASRSLASYAQAVEASPDRLREIEERAQRLRALFRKYGPGAEQVTQRRVKIDTELSALATVAQQAARRQAEVAGLTLRASEAAAELSRRRRAAATVLAEAIGAQLAELAMGSAQVVVEVTPASAAAGALNVDGARLTRTGADRVEFLIAPNRGEPPRPLRRIASGGELSRALLALKRVLSRQGPASTYVFDEVDAGVGGAVAEVIGRAIRDIAQSRQVVCITHLPQIAALADTHFVVDKVQSGGRTIAKVHKLSQPQRVEEIARMMGGVRVGEATRKAAAELLAAGGDRGA